MVNDDAGYDPSDFSQAHDRVVEWGERIPIGILYQTSRPTYGEQVPGLDQGPVVMRELERLTEATFQQLRESFM